MLRPRQTKKRWFTVHVHADRAAAEQIVGTLQKSHTLVQRCNGHTDFRTFDLHISPKVFREFQQKLPQTILIAYELLEP